MEIKTLCDIDANLAPERIHDERLTGLIVHNLHRRVLERKQAATAVGTSA